MERARVNGIELDYKIKGYVESVLLIHGSHVAGSFKLLLAQPAHRRVYAHPALSTTNTSSFACRRTIRRWE